MTEDISTVDLLKHILISDKNLHINGVSEEMEDYYENCKGWP